jgi:hypothetical protein
VRSRLTYHGSQRRELASWRVGHRWPGVAAFSVELRLFLYA